MTAPSLIDLIRKRHFGPAWIVLEEVPNATGTMANRRADALAIGLWPSHKFPIIAYEIKISREDVKRELKDPSKADAIGKYADEFWLVISDEAIIDGLVIAPTWGILAPRKGILRVVRKATKLDPAPVSRAFVAALIRNVCGSWVPKHEHEALAQAQREDVMRELVRDGQAIADSNEIEIERLRQTIATFESLSGVKLVPWDAGNVGAAVKLALAARTPRGRSELDHSIQMFEGTSRHHAYAAGSAASAAAALRELRDAKDQLEIPSVADVGDG